MIFVVIAPFDHKYVYGAVPPVAVTLAEPVAKPVQVAGNEFNTKLIPMGWLTVSVTFDVHPLKSVTV